MYLAVRDKLGTITGIEYIDINRNQFGPGKDNYPQYFTACLIRIVNINWQTMLEQVQEGTASIEVTLYTLDGFADQMLGTTDSNDGLIEMELIDEIAEQLQFLQGETFKPLQQDSEESIDTDIEGLMAYKLMFSALVYRKTAARYTTIPNPFKP